MAESTAVEFRTGIGDRLGYASRWLRKASERGARVRVIGALEDLSALSHLLWVADKEGFLPHAQAGIDHQRPGISRTAIWIGAGPVAGPPPVLLLNLGADVPDDWRLYERIIELVAGDEPQAQAGRERWAEYRRLGLQPAHRVPSGDDGGSA